MNRGTSYYDATDQDEIIWSPFKIEKTYDTSKNIYPIVVGDTNETSVELNFFLWRIVNETIITEWFDTNQTAIED